MNVRMYKSLDKTSSLFGIRGMYIYVAVVGIIIAVVVGFGFVGLLAGSLLGTLVAFALAALAYFGVMMTQANFSERQLQKKLSSFSLPDFIVLKPRSLCKEAKQADYNSFKQRKS